MGWADKNMWACNVCGRVEEISGQKHDCKFVLKSDLRRLVEDWDLIEEVSGSTYTKRCIEDIEQLLGGE